jgi:hypothetical protein
MAEEDKVADALAALRGFAERDIRRRRRRIKRRRGTAPPVVSRIQEGMGKTLKDVLGVESKTEKFLVPLSEEQRSRLRQRVREKTAVGTEAAERTAEGLRFIEEPPVTVREQAPATKGQAERGPTSVVIEQGEVVLPRSTESEAREIRRAAIQRGGMVRRRRAADPLAMTRLSEDAIKKFVQEGLRRGPASSLTDQEINRLNVGIGEITTSANIHERGFRRIGPDVAGSFLPLEEAIESIERSGVVMSDEQKEAFGVLSRQVGGEKLPRKQLRRAIIQLRRFPKTEAQPLVEGELDDIRKALTERLIQFDRTLQQARDLTPSERRERDVVLDQLRQVREQEALAVRR